MSVNIPDIVECEVIENNVRFSLDGESTGWMDRDDPFIRRIDEDSLNHDLLAEHIKKEILIKNTLDEAIRLFGLAKYPKAIEMLDEVLFYDPKYGVALLNKSYCLRAQKHFVKAFRYYMCAVRTDGSLEDVEYYKALGGEADNEISGFPKLKLSISTGDEYFAFGDFESAIEIYDRALQDNSRFKQKILPKLLNKKATAYLKLEDYDNALICFKESLDAGKSDYAIFGEGICEHRLNLEVNPEFRQCLKISKRQMLCQATALRDMGYADDSLRILDFLRRNHFKEDDLYRKIVDAMD